MCTPHRLRYLCCALLLIFAVPRTARAHENLISPPLRDNTNQKIRPCGGVGWGSHVTTLQPGASLLMQWVETIHHPGWFRISFRTSESGDFNAMILAAKVDSLTGIDDYSHTVTLPNVRTQQGSVQLSFVMTDQPNNTMPYGYNEYSNCTDIILTDDPNAPQASPQPTPTASGTDTGTPGSGATPIPTPSVAASGGPSSTEATEPGADLPAEGGCSAAGASAGTLGALALWLIRRRPKK